MSILSPFNTAFKQHPSSEFPESVPAIDLFDDILVDCLANDN